MNKYPHFWNVLVGNDPGTFFGFTAISVVAAFGIIFIMASNKYKNVQESPGKWSWHYFLANNAGNFLASLFVLPIFIRVVLEFISDPKWMLLVSVGLGFGFYRLAKLANDYGLWTTNKISEKIAEKIKTQEILNPPSLNDKP